ncbi:MAG: hypothetical protein AAFQ82_17790 [Myxococcota bacterium]
MSERNMTESDHQWIIDSIGMAWGFVIESGAMEEPEELIGAPPVTALDRALTAWHQLPNKSRSEERKLIQALGHTVAYHLSQVTGGYWCYVDGERGEELVVKGPNGEIFSPIREATALLRQNKSKDFVFGLYHRALHRLEGQPLENAA